MKNWLWTVHYWGREGKQVKRQERNKAVAMRTACDLMEVGINVHAITGPKGMTVERDEIERHCRKAKR